MLFFMEGLQPHNIFILFLFSMKHSYLLTAKTIQDVNNFLRLLHIMKDLLQAIPCMSEATFGI